MDDAVRLGEGKSDGDGAADGAGLALDINVDLTPLLLLLLLCGAAVTRVASVDASALDATGDAMGVDASVELTANVGINDDGSAVVLAGGTGGDSADGDDAPLAAVAFG